MPGPHVVLPWLHGLWLLVGAAALLAWLRVHREDRVRVAVTLAACAAWAAFVKAGLGPSLPVEAFQSLREGFSLDHLRYAAGLDGDVGPVVERVWRPWPGPRPSLRDSATTGLVAAGWTVIGVGALSSRLVADRWLALAVPTGLALSAGWLTVALTPLHAPMAGVYGVAAAAAWLAGRDPDLSRAGRVLADLTLVGAAALLAGTRPELAAPAAALVVGLLLRPVSDRGDALVCRVVDGVCRVPAVPIALLAAWVAVSALLPARMPPLTGYARYLAAGLHPLDVHGLLLPLVLLGLATPGLVLLGLRGAWEALRRPFAHAALPVVVWVMFTTQRVAAHGRVGIVGDAEVSPYELYRYVTLLLPAVALLAIAGARAWVPGRWRAAVALLCLVPAVPEVARLLDTPAGQGDDWPRFFGITRDAQEEVRFIAARLETHPRCGVLALGHVWGGPPKDRFGWAALVPTRVSWRLRHASLPPDASVEEVAAELLGEVPCAVALWTLDCGSEVGPGCAALAELPELERRELDHRSFVHPVHGGAWKPRLHLAWHAVPGWPTE